MNLPRTALAIASLALLAAPAVAQKQLGTLDVSVAPLGTLTCGRPVSASVTITNGKAIADKGTVSFNGGTPVPYDLLPGKSATLSVPGGTFDCSKPLALATVAAGTGIGGSTVRRTSTPDAMTVTPHESAYPLGGGTVRVNPATNPKCGGKLEVYGKFPDAPATASVDVTVTIGSQTPEKKTLKGGGAVTFTVASALDCGAPFPVYSFQVTGQSTVKPVVATVTYN